MTELLPPAIRAGAAAIPLSILGPATTTDAHICTRCATIQKTCCQRAEVLVTDGDLERIREFTGRTDFTEYRAPRDASYVDQDDDPIWAATTIEHDGTRRVLLRESNGNCTFLQRDGCSLPTEIRPLICRMYPFAYTEAGIDGIDDEYCPKALIPEGKTILVALDMNMADAQRWHKMLYDELRARLDGQSHRAA